MSLPASLPDISPPRRPWSLGDVFVVAIVFFFAVNVFGLLAILIALELHVGGIPRGPGYERQALEILVQDVRINVPAQAAAYLVGWWAMVNLARQHYHMRFIEAIRWRWPGRRWFVFLACGPLLWFVVAALSRFLPNPSKTLPIERAFSSAGAAYLLAIFGMTLAPLMEEFFFRGLLYPALARHVGDVVSIVVTAFCFALVHAAQLANSWSPLLVLFLVGLVLTIARARSGSVAASALLHAGYNASIFVTMYAATAGFHHMERLPH